MNTKHINDRAERKTAKRKARKDATPKGKRPNDVARGSNKRKISKVVKGQSKR